MRVLDARDILELIEKAAAVGPGQRALIVLETAYPGAGAETIANAPLSARDRALLALRVPLFGAALRAWERCDTCAEMLELALTADALGLGPAADPFPPAPQGRLSNGATVRAVTAGDVVVAELAPDAGAARAILAARVAPAVDDPEELDQFLEALDPAADVEIALACPACGETTLRSFDVPAFVWREFEARVPRILRDVADLARSFHWSEQEILAMPSARRAFYLAEVRA